MIICLINNLESPLTCKQELNSPEKKDKKASNPLTPTSSSIVLIDKKNLVPTTFEDLFKKSTLFNHSNNCILQLF